MNNQLVRWGQHQVLDLDQMQALARILLNGQNMLQEILAGPDQPGRNFYIENLRRLIAIFREIGPQFQQFDARVADAIHLRMMTMADTVRALRNQAPIRAARQLLQSTVSQALATVSGLLNDVGYSMAKRVKLLGGPSDQQEEEKENYLMDLDYPRMRMTAPVHSISLNRQRRRRRKRLSRRPYRSKVRLLIKRQR